MIKATTKRSILRWVHLILAIPILGYIYSPFAELPNYAAVTRFVFAPVIMARCISPVWNWGGYPESGRALHRAEDLVGDSCATFKVIGLEHGL